MLYLQRSHDFQVFMSPKNNDPSPLNPPSFNWPQNQYAETYTLYLENAEKTEQWYWENITSPFQLTFKLTLGEYRWRLSNTSNTTSEWFEFQVTQQSVDYLSPTAEDIFKLCQGHDQFLMYFGEDINLIRNASSVAFDKLKKTATLANIESITYPTHYRRGEEEGKRTAINNVRNWIDRDLIALTQLYKIWEEKESGEKAVKILLRLAEWSPEGPASLLRPCTWGDEVGLSLARNIYLAYHWLSPLMTDSEKGFVRPMLIRIAYQMEERLEQDQFKHYPGHSHTSRLPAYLGVAAITLHKEFEPAVCERWLNYVIMIYRSVLPFYGGIDGSWVEGPFYSSSYSKWQHPFFLAVERISGFSFYNHPFYKNYHKFALDFVAPEGDIHPFGDGFWCTREGKEWPGFFSQNPLRIYADRFGDQAARKISEQLESKIETYELHLLDVIPTIKQLEYSLQPALKDKLKKADFYYQFYDFAGLGKAQKNNLSLYFRASQFGNSSHRHADQGNIALIDSGSNILIPSGSYGYRFGSNHHSEWTRTTKAHNLPLIDGRGQTLDDESAVARLINQQSSSHWYITQVDLSEAYHDLIRFIRTIIMVEGCGLLIIDSIDLPTKKPVQWRLHSGLSASAIGNSVKLTDTAHNYYIHLSNQSIEKPSITQGYDMEPSPNNAVVSDASEDIYHLEWKTQAKRKHLIIASCTKSAIKYCINKNDQIEVMVGKEIINVDVKGHINDRKTK